MNRTLIEQVSVYCGFPTLADSKAFDQWKIWSVLLNAQWKNYWVVNQQNLFDLLVDALHWVDKNTVYDNNFYRSVIWEIRNKIIIYFNM
jgi:hypothetical protein